MQLLWLMYALAALLFMHWLYTSFIGGTGYYTEQPQPVFSWDSFYRLARGGNSAKQKVVPLVVEETQAATLDTACREAVVVKNKLHETLQVCFCLA